MSARWKLLSAGVFLAAVCATLVLFGALAASAGSEPQKKLFSARWYQTVQGGDYASWMDLTTNDAVLDCDPSPEICGIKWQQPFDDAIAGWNGQPTTARFDIQPDQSEYNDVSVVVMDEIPGTVGLLGLAIPFDINYDPCEDCEIRYGWAAIADNEHEIFYGTMDQRMGTITHELGHLLSLRHESVNADESVQYPCGEDDTGPIPHSLMAYNCIDPVPVGGLGENYVHDWDVCGVNHAYPDPAFGNTGCAGSAPVSPTPAATPDSPTPSSSRAPTPTASHHGPTPTPHAATPTPTPPAATPTPTPPAATPTPAAGSARIGDIDCDGDVDSVDALKALRHTASLTVTLPAGCVFAGDMDCDNDADSIDALKLLRHVASLSANLPAGCAAIGSVRQ